MSEETNSTHKCEIVPVVLLPHPNADSLSIVQVFGYTICVRTEAWQGKSLGAYIVPDSLVDVSRPEFSSLSEISDNKGKTHVRIRAKRLRGVVSYGMLIPAPEGSVEGDDVATLLGIERYNPIIKADRSGYVTTKSITVPPPEIGFSIPTYDVDAFQRYANGVFVEGEEVYVSEKIDGGNARYVFDGEKMHIGSRNRWLETEGNSMWHQALQRRPEIERFCRDNPKVVLWGEVFGFVQELHYGMCQGEVDFIAFDMLQDGKWLDTHDFLNKCIINNVPVAPSFGFTSYNFDKLVALADGPSTYNGALHYREGIVIRPVKERWAHSCGRVHLKIVSPSYYEANGAEKPWKKAKL